MSTLTERLRAAARAFEEAVVIPHCQACQRPCCGLGDVVLELDFSQVQQLYRIEKPKKEFDRNLPTAIRKQGDRYYAHGEPCPAFNATTRLCTVYQTTTKPQECSDFPIYEDGDVVTADLRCEAVRDNLATLRQQLAESVGGALVEDKDDEFPDTFLAFSSVPEVKKRAATRLRR